MRLLRSDIVRALPEDFRATLDAVGAARRWPTSRDPGPLAAAVQRLSVAYNRGEAGALRSEGALAARLGFSFARDAPKTAGAVRELVATGALTLPADRPLRVLDLGAGLGASTWGLWAALKAAAPGVAGVVESVCVDDDPAALEVAAAIARARRGRSPLEVEIRAVRRGVVRAARELEGPFDVVLLAQVLCELSLGREEQVAVVRACVEAASAHGSVVVVEPALRDKTRALHALRDSVLAEKIAGVFAPCLHAAPCPALADEGAWCHEDLDVDLPPWLADVAARAGLRWQGLTFSYLVLRRDDRTARPPGSGLVRLVSEPLVSKGKVEAFVCGDFVDDGAPVSARLRARRLDRDIRASNRAWGEAARGDILACSPPLSPVAPRLAAETIVERRTPELAVAKNSRSGD